MRYLLPNQLPDFYRPVTIQGFSAGAPIGFGKLEAGAYYGGYDGFSFFLSEAGYRYNVRNPVIEYFVLGGGHYLTYNRASVEGGIFGIHFGLGFSLPIGKQFDLNLSAKTYIQTRTILSFNCGLAYLFE